jgi:deoxyadenosine/deoxycytidine kinase
MRIEICGGIASGKTTLCNVVAGAGYKSILEDFHQNPFWSSFYRSPNFYAFETEVTFLLQHYSEVKAATLNIGEIVCDFSFLQDWAYAETNLRGAQLEAFHAIYLQVLSEFPRPSLIVHLKCDADEELSRIRRRARSEEVNIDREYLESLNQAIANRVLQFSERVPVLSIDSAVDNFADDVSTQRRVAMSILAAVRNGEMPNDGQNQKDS